MSLIVTIGCELLKCNLAEVLLAFLDRIERGSGQGDIAVLDELGHIAEEEGQHQGVDVRTIDIGIGHNDDLVIA